MTTLVLGPVRSGKTARALALARASGKRVVVAATAAVDPADAEMVDRVARHRRERPADWTLVETATPGAPALIELLRGSDAQTCILVDALGTWLSSELLALGAGAEADAVAALATLDARGAALVDAAAHARADVIVVAEETGWGIVPATRLGRLFRDAQGRLVRALAQRAERVELVVAGFAVDLRAIGRPVDAP
ncbi:MAG TPA: bifunctional adenosylcobinamide kinase/adenosylcobinamide-phosphate guanylyltransferase [Candidatus Sulfotelmatobacter sp.]|nr:bifunctional adenosylcobinamide kinase/adenosylcobinamide-phosphate guanylyltransferase [Candidatus Sulfotelmatobacter sp.]